MNELYTITRRYISLLWKTNYCGIRHTSMSDDKKNGNKRNME